MPPHYYSYPKIEIYIIRIQKSIISTPDLVLTNTNSNYELYVYNTTVLLILEYCSDIWAQKEQE
jgi:hypothetical protein